MLQDDKEPKKPEDLKPEEKKACDLPEDKIPKEEEKSDTPKWAVELCGKLDKLTDALIRAAPKEEYPPPEKKPDEEKQKPDEKKPEEVKAKEPEKYPYGTEEEKLNHMIENAIKGTLPGAVESAVAKRFVEAPIEKKAKAPTPAEEKDLSFEEFGKIPFAEIHRLAKGRGAPQ